MRTRRINRGYSPYDILRIGIPIIIFVFSLFILTYDIHGDQTNYIKVYGGLRTRNLADGFKLYAGLLSSLEPVYYFLSWIASRLMGKNIFIGLSNAVLAYLFVVFCQKRNASAGIVLLLVITNYYLMVLFFSAERLKYGFIFLLLSLIYKNEEKKNILYTILAVFSHVQTGIVYLAIYAVKFCKSFARVFNTGRIRKIELFQLLLILLPVYIMLPHITTKILAYYGKHGVNDFIKIFILFSLSLVYSKDRKETTLIFAVLSVCILFVGDTRINIFGFFIFLYYGLAYRRGYNFPVLTLSAYFFYQSIEYITNIIKYGNGFV